MKPRPEVMGALTFEMLDDVFFVANMYDEMMYLYDTYYYGMYDDPLDLLMDCEKASVEGEEYEWAEAFKLMIENYIDESYEL